MSAEYYAGLPTAASRKTRTNQGVLYHSRRHAASIMLQRVLVVMARWLRLSKPCNIVSADDADVQVRRRAHVRHQPLKGEAAGSEAVSKVEVSASPMFFTRYHVDQCRPNRHKRLAEQRVEQRLRCDAILSGSLGPHLLR